MTEALATLAALASHLPAAALVPLALVAGLATSFLPCSLASVALILAYCGSCGEDDGRKASVARALMFGAGQALGFVALSLVAVAFGRAVNLSGGWVEIILGLLMALLALQSFGIVDIFGGGGLLKFAKLKGKIGALCAGLLAAPFSSVCSTPILIGVLAMVATRQDFGFGIAALLAYSIGSAVLPVAVALFHDRIMRMSGDARYGRIATALQIGFGVLLVIAAVLLVAQGLGLFE